MHKPSVTLPLIGLYVSCALALSPIKSFSFSKNGDAVESPGNVNKECNDVATFKEDAPGIALALDKYGSRCWSDGRYNDKDYSVQSGKVESFVAYRISGPKTKATKFRGSKNTVC